ncbi:MAG: hypothetical protein KVP17_004819 [Porospora cf. gigantea B]|uniref:uncharacterized protein n=1 Tax=Porospora cf. gigantea B TaxID=2853592 RepID=UPI003571EA1A|nr:MAG: hypothetical protein KVP17_004819 [Porospora cf. gigantea B]
MLPVIPCTSRSSDSPLLTEAHILYNFSDGFFTDEGELWWNSKPYEFPQETVLAVETKDNAVVVLEQTNGVMSLTHNIIDNGRLRTTGSLRLSQALDISCMATKEEMLGQTPVSAANIHCGADGARVVVGTVSGQVFIWSMLPWAKWVEAGAEHYLPTPCLISGISDSITNIHLTYWAGKIHVFVSTAQAILIYEGRDNPCRPPRLVWKEVALGAAQNHTHLAWSTKLLRTLGVQRVTQGVPTPLLLVLSTSAVFLYHPTEGNVLAVALPSLADNRRLRGVSVGVGGHLMVTTSTRPVPRCAVPLVVSQSLPNKVSSLFKRIPVTLASQWREYMTRPTHDYECGVTIIQLVDTHKYVVLDGTYEAYDAHVSLKHGNFAILLEDCNGVRLCTEVLYRERERMEALVNFGHTAIARTFVREGLFSAKALQKLLLEQGERLFKSGRMDQGIAAFLEAYPTCRPARVVGLFHDHPELLLHYLQKVFLLGESEPSSGYLFIWQLISVTETAGNKKLARKLLFTEEGGLKPELQQFSTSFIDELRTQGCSSLALEVATAVQSNVAKSEILLLDLDLWEDGLQALQSLTVAELHSAFTGERQHILHPLKNRNPNELLDMLVRVGKCDPTMIGDVYGAVSGVGDPEFLRVFCHRLYAEMETPTAELVELLLEDRILNDEQEKALEVLLVNHKNLSTECLYSTLILARRVGHQKLIMVST